VVNRIDQGFEALGQAFSGIRSGTEGDPFTESEEITLTFTRGLPYDAGDADDTTYGFQDGSAFELEGEFVNGWLEQDAVAAAELGMDEVNKAFIYETVTAFELRADSSVSAAPTLTMVYSPDAEPNPTVTLTWSKTGAASYIAKYSPDMSNWGNSLANGITADVDENPEDLDHITATFELTGGLENEPKMFFRIEEE